MYTDFFFLRVVLIYIIWFYLDVGYTWKCISCNSNEKAEL